MKDPIFESSENPVFKTYDDIIKKHGAVDVNEIVNKGSFAIKSAYAKDYIIKNEYKALAEKIISTGKVPEFLYYITISPNGGKALADRIVEQMDLINNTSYGDYKSYMEANGIDASTFAQVAQDVQEQKVDEMDNMLSTFHVGG